MTAAPRLIITADDYGMSPLFNRGIEELAKLGLITRVSVMVNRPFVTTATTLLNFPKIVLGLHLELEEESTREVILTQIETFKKIFGKLPVFLDGHKHRHLTHHNLPLVIHIAKEYSLAVRSHFPEDRQELRASHITTPDNFISWHPDRISVLQDRLQEAAHYSLSELVVHPGYFDPACDYPYNQAREAELTFLKSPHFQKLIAPFTLISYPQAF